MSLIIESRTQLFMTEPIETTGLYSKMFGFRTLENYTDTKTHNTTHKDQIRIIISCNYKNICKHHVHLIKTEAPIITYKNM